MVNPDKEGGPKKLFHPPVMTEEVLSSLMLKPGGSYVDCTVGGGGHSLKILELTSPDGRLTGLDRDPFALAYARQNLEEYQDRITLVKSDFVFLPQVLNQLGITAVDGILYDLGVSLAQLNNPERGFSYQFDGPLDMRMDPGDPVSARDLVNGLPETGLADLIRRYGEEFWAKRIAAFIVQERKHKAIQTTGELVNIIKKAIPARSRRRGPHPAKRTFQALRIAVNQELDKLGKSLQEAVPFLKTGGRICVISFHSLEDRIVKETFKEMSSACACPPDFPYCVCGKKACLRIIRPSPITPTNIEIEQNPHSRSAKMRVAEKIE